MDEDSDDMDAVAQAESELASLGSAGTINTIDPGKLSLPVDPLVTKLQQFAPYDMNGDGIDEIEDIQLLPFENSVERIPSDGRLALVFVEPRLLDTLAGGFGAPDDVIAALERYKADLRAEGLHSRFVEMNVYDGPIHQDGLALLAMRELLRDVRADYANLEGVVLVGSFPEAMLVRRWIWRRDLSDSESVNIAGTDRFGVSFLRIVPEIVADRAEIVLADLDGNWENLYVQGPTNLTSIEAIPTQAMGNDWPINGIFESSSFDLEDLSFQDFFWIRDDNYTRLATNPKLRLSIQVAQRHPEMTAADRAMPNPLARPEILVSRINPLHVAVNPDDAFLDAAGLPQALNSTANYNLSDLGTFFHRDAELERDVLLDYFDRNHAYRRGAYSGLPARTSAVRGPDTSITSPASLNSEMKAASSAFGTSLQTDLATVKDYVNWFKSPATMRGISAHSNAWNSAFGDNYPVNDLEAAVGGNPWRWHKDGNWYIPSLESQGGDADLFIYRTVWENGVLNGTGANLFIHVGCNANSPEGANERPFNHSRYGTFQNAESLLFYMNGLAIMTRAKMFFDAPRNFGSEIGKSERNGFGVGWRGYFDADANDANLPSHVADNKKTYFWSIVGDWTVRVNYENGLAALGISSGQLTDHGAQADRSWAGGGWNYDASKNTLAGKGDFDGDGIEEILVKSDWGLGILTTHKNGGFSTEFTAPTDTWFGDWHFVSNDNTFRGTGDFDGDGRDEIIVTSPWGIGILDFNGSTMSALVAKPNGTAFGGWSYSSTATTIRGIGDFDGDGKDEIIVTNSWGIGMLALSGSTLTSLVAKSSGSIFGSWNYASTNVIRGIADFDKDGRDELLITSSWGIGVLEKYGSSFTSIVAKPNGTAFGGWSYSSTATSIKGIGDFDGDGYADIVVASSWGIGILEKSGNSFTSIVAKPNGTAFGGWSFNSSQNTIQGIGDFDGNGKDDLWLTSAWGVGVLALSSNTLTSIDLDPHGSVLRNWVSAAADRYALVGNFDGSAGEEILVQK